MTSPLTLITLAEPEEENLECGCYTPYVIVTFTITSFGGDVEYTVWPVTPEWYAFLSEDVLDPNWVLEHEFKNWGNYEWMLRERFQPGDRLIFRVYPPTYSRDYWGESDCEYSQELLEVRYLQISPRCRNHRLLQAIKEERALVRKTRKRNRWLNNWELRLENRRYLRYAIGGYGMDDCGWYASLSVEYPLSFSRWRTRKHLVRVDLSRWDLRAMPIETNAQDLILKMLQEEALKRFAISANEFSKIKRSKTYW